MAAALQPGAATTLPPGLEDLPSAAADHVVVMDVIEGACIGCGPHRRTITRSGRWVKDVRVFADRTTTLYGDFRTNTTYGIVRDRAGQVISLSVSTARGSFFPPRRREATDRRGNVSYHRCRVWLLKSEYSETEVCETEEGVQLWSQSPDNAHASRTNSIDIHPVNEDEVRPPADFFQLASWPATESGAGYDVRLTTSSRDEPRVEIRRHQGKLTYIAREGGQDARTFYVSDGERRYSYREDSNGQPIELEIELHPRIRILGSREWRPVPDRSPRMVLGERCTWFADGDANVSDVYYECRTADSVPLLVDVDLHWDSRNDFWTAQSLYRGTLASDAFAPPPRATSWAHWGAERR